MNKEKSNKADTLLKEMFAVESDSESSSEEEETKPEPDITVEKAESVKLSKKSTPI